MQPNDSTSNSLKISSSKGVNGSVSGLDLMHIDELNFHGISMKDQEVLTLDLSGLEKDYEVEIYGLIGFEQIKDYDLLFNYGDQELVLIDPNHFEIFEEVYFSNVQKTSVPIIMEGHIPVVEISVSGKFLSMGLDCGAESNLIDENLYDDYSNNLVNISTDTLSGADRIRKKVIVGDVKQVQIGLKSFERMSTIFSDISHINEGYSIKIDGILGYPLFSEQPILLSFSRKKLIFYN